MMRQSTRAQSAKRTRRFGRLISFWFCSFRLGPRGHGGAAAENELEQIPPVGHHPLVHEGARNRSPQNRHRFLHRNDRRRKRLAGRWPLKWGKFSRISVQWQNVYILDFKGTWRKERNKLLACHVLSARTLPWSNWSDCLNSRDSYLERDSASESPHFKQQLPGHEGWSEEVLRQTGRFRRRRYASCSSPQCFGGVKSEISNSIFRNPREREDLDRRLLEQSVGAIIHT